ncbi:MAG TPA: SAM-dependent methyltransferase, partial [Chloroflexia bacterium]|nr:SAM-dependent methyltransferase [Chloroflexia bacterium]
MARQQTRAPRRHPPPPSILESDQRLSRSRLWQWQRDFFTEQGIAAWRQGIVPHYITSNPFIAQAYARVVLGFLRDSLADTRRPLDLRRPVYVIELGGGSGRFAYHFLQKFLPLWQQSRLHAIPITYVLTDFAARTVAYWQAHPALQPFVAAGVLDFACYDLERDQHLTLLHSGVVLAPGTVANPLVVLANYFFDSLPQDAFCVGDGRLCESLVTLTSPTPEPEPPGLGILERVRVIYRPQPAPAPYYDDPDLDAILQAYPAQVAATTWLFPSVALRGLR